MRIAALLLLVGTSALAQRPAVLRGKVVNDADDKPVAGAEVAIPGVFVSTTSDSLGNFLLRGIPAGRQIVRVRRLGFGLLSNAVTFAAGDTVEQDFGLVVAATPLPQVDVKAPPHRSPKLSEFEERRKEGFGHFVTEAELAKHEDQRLSEIMMKIPGISIKQGGASSAWVTTARGPQSLTTSTCPSAIERAKGAQCGCYAKVILDGATVYSGNLGEPLWDINSMRPSDLMGVELYNGPATTPMKYNSTSRTCGVVVLWTK